ncbi:Tyrocidine synthase 3 [Chryseobacterium potabilaquae]|uniref:Tyrocidine synthase 3 n=2 Tax=Chryseobacterium potabilaquae TaxID=2675057 RepID=A0A6N4X9Q7_9FLAO|nr:Tyrocidine synthase 3 [Chryseobacterium potabilaquae]
MISQVLEGMELMLDQLLQDPTITTDRLSYVSATEYQDLIYNWNATGVEYDTSVTLHELFERQVEKTPDHIALVYEDVKLSYRELNGRSNQLAHYLLQNYEIKPDELIPLCLERSEQMLIGILGVLKSGGAYVPMDPNYPMDRIEHILGDTKARVVIGEEDTIKKLFEYKSETNDLSILSLNSLEIQYEVNKCSSDNPKTDVSSGDLSYVIYTSGTTGKPKGVMIEHKSVVNLMDSIREVYGSSTLGKVSAYTSYVFDVSVSEFFSALLYGNELYILSEDIKKDSDLISDYLLAHEITHTYLPPALLSILPRKDYPNLQTILYAGEPCDEETGRYWGEYKKLYNLYGPTESTIYATYREIKSGEVHLIGRSIANTTTYVLDEYLRPVPVGAIGELYIGGVGLSRGYLNLPELTDEKFLANPFQIEEERKKGYNNRIYKTGDLVRYLPGGDLEYMGRNDFQVKIRGYRIELGEIENGLLSYEGICQAAVLAKENSSRLKYLIGYYVSDTAINHEELSVHLSGLIPEYMMPSVYVHLKELPITINGKLDRRALPEPIFTGDKEYIAPETPLQQSLAEIYGEVLDLPVASIGLHDDFFRLGGNSIMAIKLISKIYHQLGIQIKVADVFKGRMIGVLSLIITNYKAEYKAIVSLNNAINKPNMFMIHSGGVGCEVYQSLADKLDNDYHCYGVDYYNLYHEEKIDNLNRLAMYYLDHMEEIQMKRQGEEYILLGWSLGGQIALEIASELESRGHKNITVYLLDTIIKYSDSELMNISPFSDEEISREFQIPMDNNYFIKIKNVLSAELILSRQNISTKLRFTKTVLLKAMLKENKEERELITEYIQQLTYNNVDIVLEDSSLLKVYPINALHRNMLEEEAAIIDVIKRDLTK